MGCPKLTYHQETELRIIHRRKELTINKSDLKGGNNLVFGMLMPGRQYNAGEYRFGFQNMERDDEWKGSGNSYTTEFRQYDPRLGRWLSIDPLFSNFPWQSPYVAFDNNPIVLTDPQGLAATDGGDDEIGPEGPVKPKTAPMVGAELPETPAPEKKDVNNLNVSQDGVDFIKSYEGLETDLYNDAAGYATIGYGHLVHYGKVGTNTTAEKPFKNGITEAKANELLKTDISNKAEKYVKANVTVPLTQNQYDALVSFTFNVGAGNFKSSTVLKKVNAKEVDSEVMTKWFKAWNKAGGKVVDGLTNRREAEADIYNNGNYVNN